MGRENLYKIFIKDDNNPAFHYLRDKYFLNVEPFSKIADLLIEVAIVSALELAELNSQKVNDYLIHFFYDLYLALNSILFSSDENRASAIIDGMHIKYFGQPSLKIITSYIQLLAAKENCFMVSFISIFKTTDFPRLLGSFSTYCLNGESVGATEGLFNAEMVLEIIKHISQRLKDEIESIMKEGS